jgi:hypothetical protein
MKRSLFYFLTIVVITLFSMNGQAQTSWSLTGNDVTDSSFLGTTTSRPLRIKVNNRPSGIIDPGRRNAFWGYGAGASITSGYNNIAIGQEALQSNTSGIYNSASGFRALWKSGGNYNTASGGYVMASNTSGNNNTAFGFEALYSNTAGMGNTAVGYHALHNTNGNYNTAIGISARTSVITLSNAIVIGYGAVVNVSNKARIGNSAVTRIEGAVAFSTPSDGRFKNKVQEDVKGLDFILQLRPVTYQFDAAKFDELLAPPKDKDDSTVYTQPDYSEAMAIRRSGFIAQEVEKAAAASGYDFSGLMKPKTEQDHYSVSYEAFVVPLVKAIQEQQQLIIDLQKQLAELKAGAGGNQATSVQVYPNPSPNTFNIQFTSTRERDEVVSLYDQSGRLLQQKKTRCTPGVNRVPFNLDSYVAGIYYIVFKSPDIQKLIIYKQ